MLNHLRNIIRRLRRRPTEHTRLATWLATAARTPLPPGAVRTLPAGTLVCDRHGRLWLICEAGQARSAHRMRVTRDLEAPLATLPPVPRRLLPVARQYGWIET